TTTRTTLGRIFRKDHGMSADDIFYWSNWVLVFALVLGLLATYAIVVSGISRDKALKRELAEQKTRTAEAELALAKLKAPRLLNEKQMQTLVSRMKEFAGQNIAVGAIPFTYEAASLADQIVRALKAAGVNAEFNQGAAGVQVGAVNGIVARATTGNEKGAKFATSFAQAMNDAGIKATAREGLLESIMGKLIEQGRHRNDPANQWVVIVVGDKI
ncbi:MAG: hypothetical protein KKD99_05170, partial [Proteobacteria bacterium]|nr:hypothetical protein [Pseudomonadota bacterium]